MWAWIPLGEWKGWQVPSLSPTNLQMPDVPASTISQPPCPVRTHPAMQTIMHSALPSCCCAGHGLWPAGCFPHCCFCPRNPAPRRRGIGTIISSGSGSGQQGGRCPAPAEIQRPIGSMCSGSRHSGSGSSREWATAAPGGSAHHARAVGGALLDVPGGHLVGQLRSGQVAVLLTWHLGSVRISKQQPIVVKQNIQVIKAEEVRLVVCHY